MTDYSGPVLKIRGLTKDYESTRALDGLDLELEAGSIVALLGANGAGKTTTFKCVLGVTSFQGTVEVEGISVLRHGREARRRIGYLPQAPIFAEGDTCAGILEFLADLKGAGRGRIEPLLERVDLWDQRRQKVSHLSGGMRQRLALAAALLADPPLLLLDEPTANLDAESRERFRELALDLRREGKAVVISTHFVDGLVEAADRIVLLQKGRLVLDVPAAQVSGRKRRYVVDLNGTAEPAFLEALAGIGIGPERVTPASSRWEEIMAAVGELASSDGEGEA